METAWGPIRIISHAACEEPGYLCAYLGKRDIPFENISIEAGEPIPMSTEGVPGIALLGSPFSVTDPYPWISDEITLVRRAARLGICFGGQLISKALGGSVHPSGGMQIGWHNVHMTLLAHKLFGGYSMPECFEAFECFEWHGDRFSLPAGAQLLFTEDCIENQGIVLSNCLALQFHLEITEAMIRNWLVRYAHCLDSTSACIQSEEQLLGNLSARLAGQRRVADAIFAWWLDRVSAYSGTNQAPASANSTSEKRK